MDSITQLKDSSVLRVEKTAKEPIDDDQNIFKLHLKLNYDLTKI